MNTGHILNLARQYQELNENAAAKEDEFTNVLDKIGSDPMSKLGFGIAWKLLAGESFAIACDNPDTIAFARALAEQIGGSVREFRHCDEYGVIAFDPPRQH